jgi:hypothetical protein
MSHQIRSWTAGLGMVVVLAAIPMGIATIQTPGISKADVCADAGGRHVDVGGCTDVARDAAMGVAVAGSDDAAAQAAAGQPPCYTPRGCRTTRPMTLPVTNPPPPDSFGGLICRGDV